MTALGASRTEVRPGQLWVYRCRWPGVACTMLILRVDAEDDVVLSYERWPVERSRDGCNRDRLCRLERGFGLDLTETYELVAGPGKDGP